jgi:transposase
METGHRYELTDRQWERLAPLLSGKNGDVGRPCDDNRRFIHGVLWVLRSGAPWRDMPERYGKWNSVFVRYNRWSKAGRWEAIFTFIANEEGIDMDWASEDSTVIRAHQHSGGQKKSVPTARPNLMPVSG